MNCEEFNKLLIPYIIDDDFDDNLGIKIKQHYLSCDDCWKLFEQQIKTINYLDTNHLTDILGYTPNVDRVEELLEYANELTNGGLEDTAIKLLQEELVKYPGNKKIEGALLHLRQKYHKGITRINIEKRLRSLSYKLHELKNISGLICRVVFQEDRYESAVFSGLKIKPSEIKVFNTTDTVNIWVEMPLDRDGYLTVFHYDDKYNIELIYPKSSSDGNYFEGGENKHIKLDNRLVLGKHYIKAIWTCRQIYHFEEKTSEDERIKATKFMQFFEALIAFKQNEWMEYTDEFEVATK